MATPTISVAMVTYNHEKYVADAIRSVLSQTFADLELVIVDDGSTDRTPELIASFDDGRIVSIRQENGGPGAAINRAVASGRGKYVALMSGDDVSMPHRLQTQLDQYVRGEPRLLFSSCEFIDDAGRPLDGENFAAGAFETTPRTRAQLFRRLFDGNFINAVTGFTERRLLSEIGPFDPALFQLQDFQLWIDFVKKYPIAFTEEPLLNYRIRGDAGNLSAATVPAHVRHDNEYYLIMRSFFDGVDEELFRTAFHAELRRPELFGPIAAACEQALLLFHAPRIELKYIGLERLQKLYGDPAAAEMLASAFDFPLAAFAEFLKTFDPLGRYRDAGTCLYIDTGKGFNQGELCAAQMVPRERFRVCFDVSAFRRIRAVRWDPLDNHFCRVKLERAVWTDAAGERHDVDSATIWTNGIPQDDGSFAFETIDPSFFMPMPEAARTIAFEGAWSILDSYSTLIRLHHHWLWNRERAQTLDVAFQESQHEIEDLRNELAAVTKQRNRMLEWRIADFVRAHARSFVRAVRRASRQYRRRTAKDESAQT